ncbi:hypothetical protein [Algoriphagus boritolerans]|uniref:hypothetical protein n=1 Tax=Algoriphagus boritolerans TaxID=308111 RepID=UPI002FCE1DF3
MAELENEEIELKKKNQERPQREAKVRDLKKSLGDPAFKPKSEHCEVSTRDPPTSD